MKQQLLVLFLLGISGALHAIPLRNRDFSPENFELEINSDETSDISQKTKECKQLVLNAVKHLEKVSLSSACYDFIYNEAWRKGDLYVFVYTADGVCLAYGDHHDQIWRSVSEKKGISGKPLISELAIAGKKNDGFVAYEWANSYKSSYVRTVTKNGVEYVVGCGFYPENDEFTTEQIVRTAATYFLEHGKEATFSLINNPNGPFVKGDIYTFAYDFNGVNVAHGNNPALINQNLIDLVDSEGKPLIKDLIELAKTKGQGWLSYVWRNKLKRSFVMKVVDPKTKIPYLISAGYHPDITLPLVKQYVDEAIKYLKSHGAKASFTQFSNLAGPFARGGMTLFVYDYAGKNLANGKNPSLVGQNLSKTQGVLGRFYIRDVIQKAIKNGVALIPYYTSNAYALAYAKNIETPDGKFIIGAEFFPSSKSAATQILVMNAEEYLREHTPAKTFNAYTTRDGRFIRGNIHMFAYDTSGARLVNGLQKEEIWRNMIGVKDQDGRPVVREIINLALNGGGWYEYTVRNGRRRIFTRLVRSRLPSGRMKDYVIGSGYFI